MKKNATIDARVSSDRQREEGTIASQRAVLEEYAQSHDYCVPGQWIFEDDGYSGGTLARPGLERLRDLVAEGLVETVLVHHPDRFSRNYAYQEELVSLEELRRRMPELRRRQGALQKELQSVSLQAIESSRLIELQGSMESFLQTLNRSSETLDVTERQRIIRLVVKQIVVGEDTLLIQHSIPVPAGRGTQFEQSYPLCTRSHLPVAGKHRP